MTSPAILQRTRPEPASIAKLAQHPVNAHRTATTWTTLACLGTVFAGCVTPPDRDEHGPLVTARRMLAMDFGTAAASQRAQTLERWQDRAAGELQRRPTLFEEPERVADELHRGRSAAHDAGAIVAGDLARRPQDLGVLLPDHDRLGPRLAEGIDGLSLLLSSRHPLNEIDDQRHRTSYGDDRDEASLVERLRRRLRL